ncbi:MAG TPA: FliH/SctL family protein [Hyphomicrobiaceae bacterium]|nr:FliH/SctL family protein [Hyphomicrobiaceae bacterium]
MGGTLSVIKAGKGEVLKERGLKRFGLADVMDEAREVVAAARAEAAGIVEETRGQAEAIREAAREGGYRAGMEEGLRQGRETGRSEALEEATRTFVEQQRSLIESCRQTIASINERRGVWEASARQDLVDLAMAIARRVARRVGQRDREVVLANITEAIELAGSRSEVTIMVSPADAEAARQFASSLVDMRKQWEHIRVVEDEEVSPGGCRIQWGSGVVDATLETQLDRIEAELREGWEAESDTGGDSTGGAMDS